MKKVTHNDVQAQIDTVTSPEQKLNAGIAQKQVSSLRQSNSTKTDESASTASILFGMLTLSKRK
ncbi:hypothetical protein HCA50_12310 [Listeria innocua]|uniref:hypothetical protein n=1 Tax=Listeria innocua TaxID=1642 RepID=UPI001623ABAC|nr:hypothetical protein [Listeria innocua]MBC1904300.1 hypothetical protein [Listeria innocua]